MQAADSRIRRLTTDMTTRTGFSAAFWMTPDVVKEVSAATKTCVAELSKDMLLSLTHLFEKCEKHLKDNCTKVQAAVTNNFVPFDADQLKAVFHQPCVLKCCDVSSLAEAIKTLMQKLFMGAAWNDKVVDSAEISRMTECLKKNAVHIGCISATVGLLLDDSPEKLAYCKATLGALKSQKPSIVLPEPLGGLFTKACSGVAPA